MKWQCGFKDFLCSSLFGEDEPNLTSIFFKGVGSTTNQKVISYKWSDIGALQKVGWNTPSESHWTFSRPFTWFISPDSKTARGPPAHVSRQLMATLPSSHPNFGSEFSKGIRAPKRPKHSGSGFFQYIAQMYGWFCSWWILFIGFLRERGSELGLRNIS